MKRNLVACLSACFIGFFSISVFAFGNVFPVSTIKTFSGAACPPSPNHDDPSFCARYPAVVACYCQQTAGQLPSCKDTKWVYSAMMTRYGSLENGCRHRKNPGEVSYDECLDQWQCYMTGHPYSGHPNATPCADSNRFCG